MKQIREWTLHEELGRGGMGVVFRATHALSPGAFAVKQIHPQWLGEDSVRARFLKEGARAAMLNHPRLVRSWMPFEDGPQIYLPQALLEGEPLDAFLASRPDPMPAPWVIEIARQICEGLAYLHAEGLIHRDLKPSNLFLTLEPQLGVTLLDFGLIKEIGGAASSHSLTGAGGVVGTAKYIAPEILEDERPTPAADIYALGLILFRLLTGREAIDLPEGGGLFPLMRALAQAHDRGLPAPSAYVSGLPAWLDALITSMLARDPASRPRDGAAALDALFCAPTRVEESSMGLDLVAYSASAPPEPQEGRRLFGTRKRVAALEAEVAERDRRLEGLERELARQLERVEAERARAVGLEMQLRRAKGGLEQARAALAARPEQAPAPEPESTRVKVLKLDNARLKAEKAKLKAQIEALKGGRASSRPPLTKPPPPRPAPVSRPAPTARPAPSSEPNPGELLDELLEEVERWLR